MKTYCLLNSDNIVITLFANSQLSVEQDGYMEMEVDGAEIGSKWTGTVFLPPVK